MCVVVIWIKYFKYPPGWDFRNNLYLPTYLLSQHQSPYNIHVLVEGSNAVWFPMVLGIFFPLGYLDLQAASNVWWLLNFVALFLLVFISTNQSKPPLPKLILVSLLIFLFPSTISHFDLGQISILICLVMVILIWFDGKIPVWVNGFLIAFTLIKPQLALIFLPTYYLSVFINKGWKAARSLGFWTVTNMVAFSLPVFWLTPNWLPDFIINIQNNPVWAHPSIYVLIASFIGEIGKKMGWILFCIGLALSLYGVIRFKNKEILLWSLAITTVISPYIWSWDFVLFYPLMIHYLVKPMVRYKKVSLLIGYLLVLSLFIAQKLGGQTNEFETLWVPWCLLILTLFIPLLPVRRQDIRYLPDAGKFS